MRVCMHVCRVRVAKILTDAGIPTRVISDNGVGAVMECVDMCLVGAEGVMMNGGIVNKMGTYQIALVAKALSKPFYAAVESYKFARMYPFTQRDIKGLCDECSSCATACMPSTSSSASLTPHLLLASSVDHKDSAAEIDFTPAECITLFFTDIGVLTPAAVSEELIRMYQ